jgi:CrcB protein
MSMPLQLLLVGGGGFLGAIARFLVGRLAGGLLGAAFPWGTFIINVSGCFLLAFVATLLTERLLPYPDVVRLSFTIGFVGAYTTFSTFEYETNALLDEGSWLPAIFNVAGSVVAGFIALRLGIFLAKRFF